MTKIEAVMKSIFQTEEIETEAKKVRFLPLEAE